MIVIGGGSIGLELGQLCQRVVVKVTLVEVLDRIAAAEEPEIGDALKQYLTEERMHVLTGIKILRVERSGNGYRVQIRLGGKAERPSPQSSSWSPPGAAQTPAASAWTRPK